MEYEMEELLPVVKALSEKYTSKESTSVTYEVAEQLMGAVIYCMEERNQADGNNPTKSVKTLDKMDAQMAYKSGYEAVVEKVKQSKAIYEELIADFNSYGSKIYSDTILKGMPSFFTYYDVKYNPQNHMLTLDYPILGAQKKRCGVDIIYEYLFDIRLEQRFLSALPEEYVREVLTESHHDYEDLFENICRVVLRNAINHIIKDAKEFTKGCTKEEVEAKLVVLIKELVKQGFGEEEDLFQYLKRDVTDFAYSLCNQVQ